MNTLQAKLASLGIQGSSEPMYQNLKPTPKNNTKKNCGMKPPQFLGTKKNPAFNNWKKCSVAAGGKRTRKSKKSRRATRRHR